jgi:two-component sensor histidine kinase
MALGFIVNELVTNAIKYAFPPPAAGRIAVSFHSCRDGWRLLIADDGAGPAEQAEAKTQGLGRRLVAAFVGQIGATLEITESPGLTYAILGQGPDVRRSDADLH